VPANSKKRSSSVGPSSQDQSPNQLGAAKSDFHRPALLYDAHSGADESFSNSTADPVFWKDYLTLISVP